MTARHATPVRSAPPQVRVQDPAAVTAALGVIRRGDALTPQVQHTAATTAAQEVLNLRAERDALGRLVESLRQERDVYRDQNTNLRARLIQAGEEMDKMRRLALAYSDELSYLRPMRDRAVEARKKPKNIMVLLTMNHVLGDLTWV